MANRAEGSSEPEIPKSGILVLPTGGVVVNPRGVEMDADTAWVLISAALVLFMVPGLALFYGGMV
ncbi:MAG: ammonium transporter, partial [bacterium]|nr:ammonium transporter [bacterium]